MNQQITQQPAVKDTLPMTSVGMTSNGNGSRIAPQNLGEVVKFAEVMCRAGNILPPHLRNNPGACMAITMQALDWRYNPFAVASKSYEVNGRIAYEAQLIAAVVNTRSGIKGRLRYSFSGEGATLSCKVVGILDGTECEYETPPIGSITVKNSPLWKSDPRQQLAYFGARAWARRHCPEVILGVHDREEAQEMKDVTPSSGLADRLKGSHGGFSADGVAATLDDAVASHEEPAVKDNGSSGSPVNDNEADPDVVRAGATAASDGEVREVPEDLTTEEGVWWLEGYDSVRVPA